MYITDFYTANLKVRVRFSSNSTRPTGHEAPALLKHHSSASFISIINHSSALLALLALLKLLALLVLLALLALLALSKLLALFCVILESS